MTHSDEQGGYAPIGQGSARAEVLHRLAFDMSTLSVTAPVIICELDAAAKPVIFPWEAYAEAAQSRGISVDDDALRDLPHTVLLSDELTEIYELRSSRAAGVAMSRASGVRCGHRE